MWLSMQNKFGCTSLTSVSVKSQQFTEIFTVIFSQSLANLFFVGSRHIRGRDCGRTFFKKNLAASTKIMKNMAF